MKTELFYFSGTGNSLAVAKDLAEHLGGARLRSMPAALKPGVATDADCIGLIFPVYYYGPPRLVADFIRVLAAAESAYIFAVCTCGGSPGGTLTRTRELLASRGLSLKAGFVVQMPGNYIVKYSAIPGLVQRWMRKREKEKVKSVARLVSAQQTAGEKKGFAFFDRLGAGFYDRFIKGLPAMDGHFRAGERCNQCRQCERICPARNISMTPAGPEWGGRCEMCLACLQWCPAAAIQYGEKTAKRRRYHHPDITVEELIKVQQTE